MAAFQHGNIHHATPSLIVQDSRGLTIRNVAYYRADPAETPEPRITRQVYGPNGHLAAVWDPRQWMKRGAPNLTTQHSLSGVQLLNDSVDAGWKATMPGAVSEPRFEWNGRRHQRRIDYDGQLRPTAIAEHPIDQPAVTTERLTYANSDTGYVLNNQCGRLVRHDDTAGCVHFNDYNLVGTKISESRQFSSDVSVTYWPEELPDRDKKLESDVAVTRWTFNTLGDLLIQSDARANQHLFTYDIAGRFAQIKLRRPSCPDAVLISHRGYNANGQIEIETSGNGVVTTRRYDAESDRLIQLMSARTGHVLQNLVYRYDPVGNISQIQDLVAVTRYFRSQRTDATSQYRYDSLSQLVEACGRECVPDNLVPGIHQAPAISAKSSSTYKQKFSYDRAGNLTTLIHEGLRGYTREMVTTPASNRSLPKPDAGEPDFINSFDNNGNLLTLSSGTRVLHWDCRNQLSEVVHVRREDEPDDDESYRYDSLGQRLRKVLRRKTKSSTATREVRYLPGLEIHIRGDVEVRHVMTTDAGDCNARALHWKEKPPAGIASDQLRYSLGDHLGSCTLELDEAAAVISQEGYYAFGGTAWWIARSETEAQYKTVRYSGKEQDATGLYYYGLRYYAPWLLRWINPDPAGDIDGVNRYRMVQNNPLRFKDDQGLSPVEPINEYERTNAEAGHVILYRRAKDLPENERREFESNYSTMLNFTKNAISALSGKNLTSETQAKLRHIYGNNLDEEHLKTAAHKANKQLKKVLHGAVIDQGKADRFVFTSNHPLKPDQRAVRKKFKSQGSETIYLNLKGRQQSPPRNAGTLFHELSHVHAGTKDFWYLFADSSPDDTKEMIDANMEKALQKSSLIAKNGPDVSKMKERNRAAVAKLTQRAMNSFHSPDEQALAAQIAITTKNADSLAALALQFRSGGTH